MQILEENIAYKLRKTTTQSFLCSRVQPTRFILFKFFYA